MPDFAEPLARLINEFKRLPGIGQKSAQRIAFHIMRASRDDAEQLSQRDSGRERQAHHLRDLQQHQRTPSFASIAAIRSAIRRWYASWKTRITSSGSK